MAQTRFNFTGVASLPKADVKRPFVKEMEKNGRKMLSLNFGVKESDNNMAFVEAFDGEQSEIMTMNTDNEKIKINNCYFFNICFGNHLICFCRMQ